VVDDRLVGGVLKRLYDIAIMVTAPITHE